MADSAKNAAGGDSRGPDTTRQRVAGMMSRWAFCLGAPLFFLSGCNSEPTTGEFNLNQPGGLTLSRPGFLTGRAIDDSLVEAQVSVDVDGVNYPATRLPSSSDDLRWIGEVFVPQGSDAALTVKWVETGVDGLPAELDGVLLLATYEMLIPGIDEDKSISIDAGDYDVESTEEAPRPDLDIDGDGVGNLQERLDDSDPNDPEDKPPEVIISFVNNAPIIDGRYDSLWNTSQFEDQDDNELLIDKVQIDKSVIQPGEPDRRYRWAGMHDGQYLYLMVFAELSGAQTPFGDSLLAYDDDAIDIFLDGNNSKGTSYDGVDDYHAIITLLSEQGTGSANSTSTANTRFELGDRSAPIDVSAFEFTTCICRATGEQQIYEVKLDLQQAGIPIGESFGLDIQLNNDVNGGERDAKWAWHNNTGEDDTWRFPIRMGTARLEPEPQ